MMLITWHLLKLSKEPCPSADTHNSIFEDCQLYIGDNMGYYVDQRSYDFFISKDKFNLVVDEIHKLSKSKHYSWDY